MTWLLFAHPCGIKRYREFRVLFFLTLIVLTIALVVFGAVPLPNAIVNAALSRFEQPRSLLLFVAGLLWLAYRLRGTKGVLISLGATLIIPALELAAIWQTAESDGTVVIGGLLPWSDAAGYYHGGQLLSSGGQLREWHGRRPWFPSLLGVLLWIVHGNLKWAVVILMTITAISFYLLARTLRASLDSLAAVTALLVLFIFYGRFVATTMSEHLGLALGAVALAALWQGSLQPRLGWLWVIGVWLLTCGLVARAGAFLVLPALVAWGGWRAFSTVSAREGLRVLALSSGAIAAGFMLDLFLRKSLTPTAVPFGNFSQVLYGLVVGYKGWTQALQDHPEIRSLGEADQARFVYRLAWEMFLVKPTTAINAVLSAWQQYLSTGYEGLLGFMSSSYRLVPYGLGLLGVVNCARHWRIPPYSMSLAMAGGLFLSVPFIPPIDSDGMRVNAATIPLIALLIALGLSVTNRTQARSQDNTTSFKIILAIYGAVLVVLIVGGATALRVLLKPEAFGPGICPEGQRSMHVRIYKGSHIRLFRDKALEHSKVPDVRIADYRGSLDRYTMLYRPLYLELATLQPGETLRFAINLERSRYGEALWLISAAEVTADDGIVHVCAKLAYTFDDRHFYRAVEVNRITAARG